MRLHRIEVKDFRSLTGKTVVEIDEKGLTVIAGDNEEGKSTLVAAVRTVLFERYKVSGAAAESMLPFGQRVRPSIKLDFSMAGERFSIRKAFCSKPEAELHTPSGRFEGEDAEHELERVLKTQTPKRGKSRPEHQGIWGILWVEQGRTFEPLSMPTAAKRTLQSTLQREVGEVLGGESGNALLEAIDNRASQYFGKKDIPVGEYKKLMQTVTHQEHEVDKISREIDTYGTMVDELSEAIAQQRSLRAQGSLDKAKARFDSARAQAETTKNVEAAKREAEQDHSVARAELDTLTARNEERIRSTNRLKTISEETKTLLDTLGQHKTSVSDAIAEQQETEIRASDAQAVADELQAKRQKNQQDTTKFIEAERKIAHLDRLSDQVRVAEARLQASSLRMTLKIPDHKIRIDGNDIGAQTQFALNGDAKVEIEGVGTIEFSPKGDEVVERKTLHEQAMALYDEERERLGEAFFAEFSEEKRLELEENHAALKVAFDEATSVLREAKETAEKSRRVHAEARERLAKAESTRKANEEFLSQLNEQLTSTRNEIGDKDLGESLGNATQCHEHLAAELKKKVAAYESTNVEEKVAEFEQAERQLKTEAENASRLERKIDDLRLEISASGRAGLGERFADAEADGARMRAELKKMDRDASATRLLKSVLHKAADEAKASFLQPIQRRMAPFLRELIDDAELNIDQDLQTLGLQRGTVKESFESLSIGTREQIAILTRLAFAQILQDDGVEAPILLDDALVYSDKTRFEKMKSILKRASDSQQVLIFTCREDDWNDSDFKTIRLADCRTNAEEPLKEPSGHDSALRAP